MHPEKFIQYRTLICRILFMICIGIITYLAVNEVAHSSVFALSDKLNHGLAFLTLAALLDYAFPNSHFGRHKIGVLLAYGAAIEILQYVIPYRTCSLWDFAVDALGVGLYRLCVPWLIQLPGLEKLANRPSIDQK